MTSPLTIALDYDGTFTEDKEAWSEFIRFFRSRGHDIYFVTMRSKEHDWHDDFAPYWPDKVIFCDGKPKKQVVDDLEIKIDVWIDDNPFGIYRGSTYTPEALAIWRSEQAA